MATDRFPTLTLCTHPLVQHKLTLLRDVATPTREFRLLVDELALLVAYEATRDLPTATREVETPLEHLTGSRILGDQVVLVPILRAGLGMVDGIAQLIPTARVGHIGLYRNEETLEPVEYYAKLPAVDAATASYMILDPMLATGGSAAAAVSLLKARGARRVRLLCLVSAPEGVRHLAAAHPDVPVFTCALDRELNEHGYILPGLGDAGDRLFGTK
ncbi:MAG: uracil phosphoribosyltransferase [Gemmatimonadales bacterium]|nr:uracil phosphoribosyltransferase [Gemmatimonadales bacterium]